MNIVCSNDMGIMFDFKNLKISLNVIITLFILLFAAAFVIAFISSPRARDWIVGTQLPRSHLQCFLACS